jgi:hypothetical protein
MWHRNNFYCIAHWFDGSWGIILSVPVTLTLDVITLIFILKFISLHISILKNSFIGKRHFAHLHTHTRYANRLIIEFNFLMSLTYPVRCTYASLFLRPCFKPCLFLLLNWLFQPKNWEAKNRNKRQTFQLAFETLKSKLLKKWSKSWKAHLELFFRLLVCRNTKYIYYKSQHLKSNSQLFN